MLQNSILILYKRDAFEKKKFLLIQLAPQTT